MDDLLSASDFELEAERLLDLATAPARKLDTQLNVQFYKHAELNSAKSHAEGRKIFDEHVYVRIMAPANRLNVIERRATEDDKTRFARQYSAFLSGLEQLASGTPLSELPTLTAAQVLELRALKVQTVEQLATIPDSTVGILGVGGQELKQRAIRYLDSRADVTKLSDENRALREQLAAVMAKIGMTQGDDKVKVDVTTSVK